jgi:hypothetical protein
MDDSKPAASEAEQGICKRSHRSCCGNSEPRASIQLLEFFVTKEINDK